MPEIPFPTTSFRTTSRVVLWRENLAEAEAERWTRWWPEEEDGEPWVAERERKAAREDGDAGPFRVGGAEAGWIG